MAIGPGDTPAPGDADLKMHPRTGHIHSRMRRERKPKPRPAGLPPAWLLIPNLTRAVLLWFLVHVALWAVMPGPLADAVNLTPLAALMAAAATAGLAHVDARVMHEPLFYANLGVPRWTPAVTAFITALTIDIALAVIV